VSQRIAPIVDFEDPPVVEVVLGIQFQQAVIDLEVLADYAKAVKPAFPHRQQVEPLPKASEPFGRPPQHDIEIRLGGGPPLPRTWFQGDDQRLLLQLQADRLVLNWRRIALGDRYPRYETLRPQFDALLGTLSDVLRKLGRKRAPINHVEVSYNNELSTPGWDAPDAHPPLSDFLVALCRPEENADSFLPQSEDTAYRARFRMGTATEGAQAGRLVVQTDAAYRSFDVMPIYLLKLSAFMAGTLSDDEEVVAALDRGREWVVKGFLELVRPEVQEHWGRRDAPA
jgi:uncharacterized protein (TIGR04255 family)